MAQNLSSTQNKMAADIEPAARYYYIFFLIIGIMLSHSSMRVRV